MPPSKSAKKRKIDDECRVFSDRWTHDYLFVQCKDKAVCLVCKESISVFKEYNIRRHYEALHKNKYDILKDQIRSDKIEAMKRTFSAQQNFFKKRLQENLAAIRASFHVAKLIAESGRPFTDGEFVKKCFLKVTDELCPEKTNSFNDVSLSARTVTRRIEDMGEDLLCVLKKKTKTFEYFSLALDESNDVCDTAQLLIFVRGIDPMFEVTEELAALQSLKGTTTGEDIYLKLCETLKMLDLKWENLKSVTTDGAKNMIGNKSGVVGRINAEIERLNIDHPMQFHCIIHQQSLCSKVLRWESVMNVVVSTVNFIRHNGLTHRQFQQFLSEIEAEYGDVLYHAEVRWLSRGKVLKRFFELRSEINFFLTEKGKQRKELSDPEWIWELAFLTDISQHLNELNTRLQGKGKLVSEMFSDVKAFEVKLKILIKHANEANLYHFPCCKLLSAEESNTSFPQDRFTDALKVLQTEFQDRFRDFHKHSNVIRLFQNPFEVEIDEAPEMYQLELADLQTNDVLKDAFNASDLIKFYACLPISTFINLRRLAAGMITVFGNTYTCEQTFSRMKLIKSKFRSRLTDDHLHQCLRLSVTNLDVDVSALAAKMQAQSSH